MMTPRKTPNLRKSAEAKSREAEKQRKKKDDGARLGLALKALSLSQAEAARRSEIPQGQINDILNGRRAVGREDLRSLGQMGISPEYILGLTDELRPPGCARTPNELATDLAAHIKREVDARVQSHSFLGEDTESWIDGERALRLIAEDAIQQASRLFGLESDTRTFVQYRPAGR
jgi:transcriptional regulator with XRE-family HTH domain